MNIYNRCFDDQSQLTIRLETAAIEGIFELVEERAFEVVWSFMLDYENSLNPHEDKPTISLRAMMTLFACSKGAGRLQN
jgi:hypothetical protein